MFLPLPESFLFAKSWFMKSLGVKPLCANTPCSRYWQNITSSFVRAEAEPTHTASSPAETM